MLPKGSKKNNIYRLLSTYCLPEDEMIEWHHPLNGHDFEQTPGDGEGQGRLECCTPRDGEGQGSLERCTPGDGEGQGSLERCTPGDAEGQGSLERCGPWGRKVRHHLATEQQQFTSPFTGHLVHVIHTGAQ